MDYCRLRAVRCGGSSGRDVKAVDPAPAQIALVPLRARVRQTVRRARRLVLAVSRLLGELAGILRCSEGQAQHGEVKMAGTAHQVLYAPVQLLGIALCVAADAVLVDESEQLKGWRNAPECQTANDDRA